MWAAVQMWDMVTYSAGDELPLWCQVFPCKTWPRGPKNLVQVLYVEDGTLRFKVTY